jgi:hypothetical protein
MTDFFQSLGITLTVMIFIAMTIILTYISYILGIGFIVIGTTFFVYKSIRLLKRIPSPSQSKVD